MTGPRLQTLEGIGRVSTEHLFALGNGPAPEVGLNVNGGLDLNRGDSANSLCEATLNSVMTIAQIEAMLDTAVAKARGNLFSAARMLGVTQPQIAYSLERLREGAQQNSQALAR